MKKPAIVIDTWNQIEKSKFELADFGEWVRLGKIRVNADTRAIPKVLKDEEATQIFITGGVDSIKYAKRHLDQKEESDMDIGSIQLKNASLAQLAHWMAEKLEEHFYEGSSRKKSI